MEQRRVFPYYREYVRDLSICYDILKEQSVTGTFEDLCKLRGYLVGSEQYKLMEDLNFQSYEVKDVSVFGTRRLELGLVSDGDYFLIENRFVIPVYGANGDLLTLIGYYPDFKKYITLPTMCFSKEVLFFNIDNALELSWSKFNGLVFLVEGIFDCLSLRALGLPAIATMGNIVADVKLEVLKLFKKVAYIPDNDKTGRRSLNKHDKKYGWVVPYNATAIRLTGSYDYGDVSMPIKDIDKAICMYDADSMRDILLELAQSTDEIVDLRL